MNTKYIIQVLFVVIIMALLVITVIVYYNDYWNSWNSSPVEFGNEFGISPDHAMSEMSSMMTSQGIQCENMLYTKKDTIQLKVYWELINKYKLFHIDGVRKINSGKSSEVRTLTWHCTSAYDCGGLGYRIYGITASLLLAIATDRVLLLKWDKTSLENTFLLPNMIDWRYPNDYLNGSFKDLGRFYGPDVKSKMENMVAPLVGNTTHLLMLYNRLTSMERLIQRLNKAEMDNLNLSQANNLQLFQEVSFMSLFRISKELKLFADIIHNKLHLHGKRYVALHLRTGKIDRNIQRERFISMFNDTSLAAQCAIRQADKLIGPDGIVVVVSDSAAVKQRLAKKYSRVKILDNAIVHVDKAKKLDNNGMLGTWQDIIIMAEAHVLLYHQSAFPVVSIAMCGLPKERIFDFQSC